MAQCLKVEQIKEVEENGESIVSTEILLKFYELHEFIFSVCMN